MRKLKGRERRHRSIRRKIAGTAEKPRLSVFRSSKNLYAQLVDDLRGRTLLSFATNAPDFKKKVGYGGNKKAARFLGEEMAKRAAAKGFAKVVFDRGGYRFHGRVKEFADAARKNGMAF